jgi:hypothetical protein
VKGSATVGASGSVVVATTDGGTTSGNSGLVSIDTGDVASGAANTGAVTINTGNNGGSGDGGDIVLTPGTSVGGTDGIVNADGVLFATNGITATATSRLSTHQLDSSAIEMNLFGTGDRQCFIDFHSDDTNIDKSARIIRNSGVNGALDIINIGSGNTTISSETGLVKIQHNALLTNYGETESYSVYQDTTQSVSTASTTFISWNTPVALSAAIGTWVLSTVNTTDDSITVPVAGRYQIDLKIVMGPGNGTGYRNGRIYVNNVVIDEISVNPPASVTLRMGVHVMSSDLSAGDKVSASIFQTSGISLTLNNGSAPGTGKCRITIRRV